MLGKIFTLSVLYFVQGLPYGFQDKFVPLYLRGSGFSHTKLSLMKLLLVPWLCKAGLAPLIDLFRTKWFWLMFSLIALTFVSFVGMFIGTQHFVLLSVWLFLLNLFSAFQDVSVDALAMNILQECEMGHGNTAQIVGYKIGSLFGGGILFWVHYYHGWTYLCLSLASLYIMAIVAFLPMFTLKKMKRNRNITESDTSKDTHVHSAPVQESSESSVRQRLNLKTDTASDEVSSPMTPATPTSPLKDYTVLEIPPLIFSVEGTVPVILFLLIYKLGERGALNTFPLFLVDQGVSIKDIGLWSGICGQLASLAGSVVSGWLISWKCNLQKILEVGMIVRFVTVFIHVFSLCMLEFAAGFMTTGVFTMMMFCSLKAPSNLQATHYSVLSSVEVAGKLLFASFSGLLVDNMGVSMAFFIFCGLSGLPNYFLQRISKQRDR